MDKTYRNPKIQEIMVNQNQNPTAETTLIHFEEIILNHEKGILVVTNVQKMITDHKDITLRQNQNRRKETEYRTNDRNNRFNNDIHQPYNQEKRTHFFLDLDQRYQDTRWNTRTNQ